MTALTIRRLDPEVKQRLRARAAANGRSMESEARLILAEAVAEPKAGASLFTTLLARFDELGGVELETPPRDDPARAAKLDQ